MCESKVFMVEEGVERLVLDEVILLKPVEGGFTAVTLNGEAHVLRGVRLAYIDFLNHKVVLVRGASSCTQPSHR